jgi:trk system potassium uptake protein TrkH
VNFPMIRYVLSAVLRVEGLLFALPLITAAVYREWAVAPVYLVLLVGCVAVGQLFSKKPKDMALYQKDGYVIVAFAWILLSLVGRCPSCSPARSAAISTRCLKSPPVSPPPVRRS